MSIRRRREQRREEGSLREAFSRSDGVLAPCAHGVHGDAEDSPAKSGAVARRRSPRRVDMEDATAKLGALRVEDEFLPGTASLSDSDRSPSFGASALNDTFPITGRLSHVTDDYVVFPRLVLGEGHYGRVCECVHRRTRKASACKSIRKTNHNIENLRNEVRILSEMDHAGVMRMVDCYEDADYVHIVSERCTGGELFDVIVSNRRDSGCVSEPYAARVAKQLLEAVAHLHDNDVVHRDIKPENVLFQSHEERTVKLIDFGLARKHGRREGPRSSVPAGTSYYMSPEVLDGSYDKSCDLWAVGVIVYMLLSGHPPFGGETDAKVFEAIERGSLRFPSRQWHSKSDEAKEFVKYLLRRDPRTRMTAKEALEHPWIRSLGQRRERRRTSAKSAKAPSRVRYLRIP